MSANVVKTVTATGVSWTDPNHEVYLREMRAQTPIDPGPFSKDYVPRHVSETTVRASGKRNQ